MLPRSDERPAGSSSAPVGSRAPLGGRPAMATRAGATGALAGVSATAGVVAGAGAAGEDTGSAATRIRQAASSRVGWRMAPRS